MDTVKIAPNFKIPIPHKICESSKLVPEKDIIGKKILITTMPMMGHVLPTLPIAKELAERGFEIMWFLDNEYKDLLDRENIAIFPNATKYKHKPIDFNFFNLLGNFCKIKKLAETVFVDWPLQQYDEFTKCVNSFGPDLIITDCIYVLSLLVSKMRQDTKPIPCVVLGIIPFPGGNKFSAPYGMGLKFNSTFLGKIRNYILNKIVNLMLYNNLFTYARNEFEKIGVSIPNFKQISSFNFFVENCDLYLQGSHYSFEYPIPSLFKNVKIVGPYQNFEKDDDFMVPSCGYSKMIFITHGTVDKDPSLLKNYIDALQDEKFCLLCLYDNKNGYMKNTFNVNYVSSLSYDKAIAHSDIFITNGGYGGVNLALKYGVPIIVTGRSDDKGEVAARVERAGVGIYLKTKKPKKRTINRAVYKILNDQSFKSNCSTFKISLKENYSARITVDEIEYFLRERTESK